MDREGGIVSALGDRCLNKDHFSCRLQLPRTLLLGAAIKKSLREEINESDFFRPREDFSSGYRERVHSVF